MNKRILEIAEKSYIYDRQNDSSFFNKELFAELIVRECMTNLYLNGYDDAVVQIQKHFGVEQ